MKKPKTTLPATLRVCGRDYSMMIEGARTNTHVMGVHHGVKNHITVDANLPPGQERGVAFHEVFHSAEFMSGLDIPEEHVTILSAMLFATLRDNPEFVKYLMEE